MPVRRLGVGAVLVLLAFPASEAVAQMSVGADLQMASRYQWRGVTRAQAWVLQPALSLATGELCPGSQAVCLSVAAGMWANYQLSLAGADELSDLPPGTRGFSEWNMWLEVPVRHELFETAVGVNRYLYPSADSGGFRTSANNAWELYGRVRLPRVPGVKPTVTAWLDLSHGFKWFIEVSAIGGLDLIPLLANLDLGATVGVNPGQDIDVAWPGSARGGVTYLELTAGPSFNFAAIPGVEALRVALIFHWQGSYVPATRRASRLSGATQDAHTWVSLSGSWTF